MTEPNHILTHHEVVSNAGKARAAKLSPERRREIAIKAYNARGTKNLPKATHDGCIEIGDKKIDCWVLKGGIRVISSAAIRSALGLSSPNAKSLKKAKDAQLPTFLLSNSLAPYLEEVFEGRPDLIYFTSMNGQKTEGVEATCLPKICEAYLKARDDKALTTQQKKTGLAADIIMRALAHVGITALVDEATGFQEERARDELQTLLKKFISDDLLKWTQKFPHQFFREMYRLYGWKYEEGQCRHPLYLGQFINKYVYDAIAPEVLTELKRVNWDDEKNKKKGCHHQFLTEDIGQPALEKHLLQVVTLLKISQTKQDFNNYFEKLNRMPKEIK